ncbi:hypothetical protein SAMN05443248_0367 [Bradyrhizobium erythrophlei]|uniref:Uncharacterized protein n=1 Tax=Bradyrhizobium erythrophlei TaxID=1437360 RepID=A0A1M5H940_9BRAD|nr:hypothetical protein SAMN05443248_0367 [Bradyrhizobium erythrophlei]
MLWIFAGNIAPRGARARLLNGLVPSPAEAANSRASIMKCYLVVTPGPVP